MKKLNSQNVGQWNNIPIPLQDFSNFLIKNANLISNITRAVNKANEELTAITKNIFTFAEASGDSIREQVYDKVTQLNTHMTHQLNTLQDRFKVSLEKTAVKTLDRSQAFTNQEVQLLRAELRAYVEDRNKASLRILRQEMDTKV